MTVGPWFLFDQWLLNHENGGVDVSSDTFKAVICGGAQVLGKTFTGASGLAKYADLTDEKGTAGGYTAGGLALTGKSRILAGGIVTLTFDFFKWTITSNIAGAKYVVIIDDTVADKFLMQAIDLDIDAPGTNTVTIVPDEFRITPHANGFQRKYQL